MENKILPIGCAAWPLYQYCFSFQSRLSRQNHLHVHMYSFYHVHCASCDPVSLWHLTAVQFVSPHYAHPASKFEVDLGCGLFTQAIQIFANFEAIYFSNA